MSERKIYKTMQGKVVDFDKIRLANETVPAVGNMRVNARGDELSKVGAIVKSRDQVAQEATIIEEKHIVTESFTEDFGPEPEISPEEAQKILNKNRKPKTEE